MNPFDGRWNARDGANADIGMRNLTEVFEYDWLDELILTITCESNSASRCHV